MAVAQQRASEETGTGRHRVNESRNMTIGYFKPLRRKIGVVTLVVACILMAGWVNRQRVLHTTLPMGNTAFQAVSRTGTLTFRKVTSGYTIKASNDADRVLLDITPENETPKWKF